MNGKINGDGIKGPVPVIQPYGEYITCHKCGHTKVRYKKDFPYCYECYQQMIKDGEMYDGD